MIKVAFINFHPTAPNRGYWDQYMLEQVFQEKDFEIVEQHKDGDYGIVVIPARQNFEHANEINLYLARLAGVVVMLTGDEESKFPVARLKHANMKIWSMTPHVDKTYPNVDRFFGSGIAPHAASLPKDLPVRDKNWFFAGQVNNDRRIECVRQLSPLGNGELLQSKGFTQGHPPEEYMLKMAQSRVIPCPGGSVTPDTFRVFEAMEAGAIPLVDMLAGRGTQKGYWNMIFGDNLPFPVIERWETDLAGQIQYFNDVFPRVSNDIFAFWQMYKRNFKQWVYDDYRAISGDTRKYVDGITALIPTSPSYLHPDTAMIEETIASIRHHLPDAEIIVTFDGVRPQQEHYRPAYEEYIQRLLWKMNREWKGVIPMIFREPMHQVSMAREALKHVRTDKILYMEHDTPLVTDAPIEWEGCRALIDHGEADMVRFHFEAVIPKEHEEMMLDKTPIEIRGIKAIRTLQWSQRPHLAGTEFYNEILRDYFSPDARTFVEDRMYGVVLEAYKMEQLQGWNKFKIWIYAPEGTYHGLKRSYNLDGRGKDPKYGMTF